MKDRSFHAFVVIVVIAVAGYAFFVKTPSGEAVTSLEIGTIDVVMEASHVVGVGGEYIEISYSGFGERDITGWEVTNVAGFSYVFGDVVLVAGQSIRICSNATLDANCATENEWVGGDVWNDVVETMKLSDAQGRTVLTITYTDSVPGQKERGSKSFTEPVYVGKDGVNICHSNNGNNYASPHGNVGNIVKGKGHGGHTAFDIIPTFYYNVGNGVEYFAGSNWPDTTPDGVYANGCK